MGDIMPLNTAVMGQNTSLGASREVHLGTASIEPAASGGVYFKSPLTIYSNAFLTQK
jgi:hypothetical protein